MTEHGEFTWVDLSTFEVPEAQGFYRSLLGWDFVDDDGSGYFVGSATGVPTAGLFEMPARFQEMRMPSFWMSYVAVDDVDAAVTLAGQLGGKIELELEDARGKFALIRDPAGAGFTCCQGLEGSPPAVGEGRWVRSELFVSDLAMVEPFYRELFGWRFSADPGAMDRHVIHSRGGKEIGAAQVASNDLKGEKEFWVPFFGIEDEQAAREQVQKRGGREVYSYATPEGSHLLMEDSQGAAFFLTESVQGRSPRGEAVAARTSSSRSPWRWRAATGLLVVYLAVFLEWSWLWGVLFLMWVLPDLKRGTTHFIEPVARRANPFLYWAIVLTWIGLSLFLLAEAFLP